jgi:hypothetical protein
MHIIALSRATSQTSQHRQNKSIVPPGLFGPFSAPFSLPVGNLEVILEVPNQLVLKLSGFKSQL